MRPHAVFGRRTPLSKQYRTITAYRTRDLHGLISSESILIARNAVIIQSQASGGLIVREGTSREHLRSTVRGPLAVSRAISGGAARCGLPRAAEWTGLAGPRPPGALQCRAERGEVRRAARPAGDRRG